MGAPDPEAARRRLLAVGTMLAVHAAVLLPIAGVRMPTAARETIMVGVLAQVPAEIGMPPPAAPVPPPPEPTVRPAVRPTVAPVRLPRASVAPAEPAPPPTATSLAAAPVAESPSSAVPPAPTFTPAASSGQTDVIEAPRYHADYLNNPQPPYPLLSRRAREEGTVRLRVMVDAAGHPTAVHIHASSGHERLDLAARTAVREWHFVPARQSGRAVAGWVEVPIQYKLETGETK